MQIEECTMPHYPVNMKITPEITSFFDPATNTISYIVKDPSTNHCAIYRFSHGTLIMPQGLSATPTQMQ